MNQELDYKAFEIIYGDMFHLLLNNIDPKKAPRFVNGDDPAKKFATTSCGGPLFFSWEKEICIAVDYTIIYPKIYVRKSKRYKREDGLIRAYIH